MGIAADGGNLSGQGDFGQHRIDAGIVRHDPIGRNDGLAGASGQGKNREDAPTKTHQNLALTPMVA
jgi:hypothetical protein